MADENYAIKVQFEGINDAIADLQKLQSAVANIKAPVFNLGGDEATKIAEASLKKLQLEIDALEKKKAQSAANDIARAEQLAAKQEANSQKLLAQLEKQFAAANVRVTQGGNEGPNKEAKFTAQTLQEALRFKQQLAAIDKAGFSAEDAARAREFAAGINQLNLQKIEQDFERVNTGQRNFTGNLRDASELLSIAAQKVKQFQEDASAAFAELRKSQGVLSTQASDAKGLTEALKGLAIELKNQVSTAELTADAAKVAQKGYRDTKENIDVLRATEKLAIATQTDFQTALNATSDVLKAFNLPASDAAKITDQIAATARAAGVTVNELAPQYDKLASTAAATGTTFEQLNAFIANAAQQSVNAKTSVGALNQALDGLQSGELVKKGQELGIVFDEQRIKSGGLAEVLSQLKSQGFDQNTTALNALFGNAKNVSAILPSLQSGLTGIANASGLVNKNFDTTASFNKARSSANQLKDALAEIGAAIAPFTLTVTNTLRGISSAFAQLDPSIKALIGTLAGLVGAGFAVSAVVTGTLAVVTPTIGAFKLLAKAITEKVAADIASVPSATAAAAATTAQGTAAAGAATGLKAFTIAAKASLVALAPLAAIAGVAFGAFKVGELIVQERQLREFNEQLDASSRITQQLGNETFKLASKLRALSDARAKGGGDAAKESGTLDLVRQQIAELENQKKLAEEAATKTLNTSEGQSQKNAFLNIAKDYEIQIKALTTESKKLEDAQKQAFSSGFTKQLAANTEELKKQAIAIKEAQNQDKELAIKRTFDDAKAKRDIENANAIKAVEEKNAIAKGELDRKQVLITEELKERQTLALQDKQRAFDDAQNTKKLQREEALASLQRANQEKLDNQKEARAEKLRKDDEAFAKAREERDKRNAEALSGAKQLISNEGAIATAKPEDRAKIAAQLAEEMRIRELAATQGTGGAQTQEQLIAKAKQIAQVQAITSLEEQKKVLLALDELDKANKKKQAELDKAEELARANARREADKTFEAEQNAAKLAFEQKVLNPEKQKLEKELQDSKLAFERGELATFKKQQLAEERALKLQQETEAQALKKESEAKIDAIKQKQKQEELIKDRAFEDAKIERERTFKQQQRDLDKASAIEIQQILGKSAQQIIDAIAIAKGGTALGGALGIGNVPKFASGVTNFVGGAALVGERGAEIVTLPRGSNVIPANQTKNILNNSGGNKTFNVNVTTQGSDPVAIAVEVQRELARAAALSF